MQAWAETSLEPYAVMRGCPAGNPMAASDLEAGLQLDADPENSVSDCMPTVAGSSCGDGPWPMDSTIGWKPLCDLDEDHCAEGACFGMDIQATASTMGATYGPTLLGKLNEAQNAASNRYLGQDGARGEQDTLGMPVQTNTTQPNVRTTPQLSDAPALPGIFNAGMMDAANSGSAGSAAKCGKQDLVMVQKIISALTCKQLLDVSKKLRVPVQNGDRRATIIANIYSDLVKESKTMKAQAIRCKKNAGSKPAAAAAAAVIVNTTVAVPAAPISEEDIHAFFGGDVKPASRVQNIQALAVLFRSMTSEGIVNIHSGGPVSVFGYHSIEVLDQNEWEARLCRLAAQVVRRRSNEAIKQPIGTLYELMKQCGFRCFVNKKKDRKYPTPLAEDEKKAFKGGYYEFCPETFDRNKVRATKGW